MEVKLIKKPVTYTNKEGVQVSTHDLYVQKPNGWRIRITAVFGRRDYLDLLDCAEEVQPDK